MKLNSVLTALAVGAAFLLTTAPSFAAPNPERNAYFQAVHQQTFDVEFVRLK